MATAYHQLIPIVHYLGAGAAPGISAGTSAGTGPTLSLSGTDSGGIISLTTGSSPASAGTIFTVTFAYPYVNSPIVIITPNNSATTLLYGLGKNGTQVTGFGLLQSNITTTTFAVTMLSGALTASTAYSFVYEVMTY